MRLTLAPPPPLSLPLIKHPHSYQAHFKLLQAGQYGAPQTRLRVIFLGAKRGLPLPRFPIPTHCTADDVMQKRLETGNLLRPAVRVIPYEEKDVENRKAWLQFAPHLRVSVEDAISDLVRLPFPLLPDQLCLLSLFFWIW